MKDETDAKLLFVERMAVDGDIISNGEVFVVWKDGPSSCFEVRVSIVDTENETITKSNKQKGKTWRFF